MMLDLFKLHKEEDNRYVRCWILVRGKNLNKVLKDIKKQILSKIGEKELINEIFSRLDIELSLLRFENPRESVHSWIKSKRQEAGLSKKDMERLTGTSGKTWNNIEDGKHLPSCRKLRKIVQFLCQTPFEFRCKRDDFCLRSANCIYASINFNKEYIPIVVISEMLNIWKDILKKTEYEFNSKKMRIIRNVENLVLNQHCSRPVKAAKKIDEDLAKIIGAFAADGNYFPPDVIKWEEEYQDNMEALARWLYNSFGIVVSVKKSKRQRNSYVFGFRSKILTRYLEVFFLVSDLKRKAILLMNLNVLESLH